MEVSPGLWWIRHPLPFAINHINVWAVAPSEKHPEEGWTIVDTGIGDLPTQTHWQHLFSQQMMGRVGRIIVTHFHPDHMGLAAWLMVECQAPLYIAQSEYLAGHALYHHHSPFTLADEVAHMKRHGLFSKQEALLDERQDYYREHVIGVPKQYQRLIENERLNIGGHEWRVLVGRGHSPEHISLYCEALKVCISGDMLLPKISPNVRVGGDMPESNPVKWFTDSLRFMREVLDPETLILPSHGLPFRGAHVRIDALLLHHKQRMEKVLMFCAELGKTTVQAVDLLERLFPFPLDGHTLFFAMGEAIAHLNELVDAGMMVREETTGQVYYRIMGS